MDKIIDGYKYVGGKEASKLLGVHQRTLYNWDRDGKIETIRTPGNKRLYNVTKFIKSNDVNLKEINLDDLDNLTSNKKKLNISYARVSSKSQSDDLERQKKLILKHYPKHKLIVDIGSGINFERPGFRKILDMAIQGQVNELVVAYKDRFTRFGFKLFENIIKDYSSGKITVIRKTDNLEPEAELVNDVMQIMNVYVAKMNGLRKYNKNR